MRKKSPEEHDNLERWMVSYADFVTLLFAFFVVMYAVSSVNEGKYRVLSDTLMSAFNGAPRSLEPIQIGEETLGKDRAAIDQPPGAERTGSGVLDLLSQVANQFEDAMSPFIREEIVRVKREDRWVELELNTTFMFASGSAALEQEALPILHRVADVLKQYPNHVRVEGFTDNVPINTVAFPSNWELSAARAASVVHVFMKDGVEPARMSAVGFGEYRPVADNRTAEGRNRNRRVLVIVLADGGERGIIDLERVGP